MSDHIVAKRYAMALYEAALEANAVEPTGEQLKAVVQVLEEEQDFRSFMSHPGIPSESKFDLIKQSFGQELSELVYNTLRLLIDRGRFGVLSSLYRTYSVIADERAGRAKALVYSAYELSDTDSKAIEAHFSKLTGKQISVENIIDRSLIGGVRVRIGDRLYEGSVAGKLEQLRNQLKQNA